MERRRQTEKFRSEAVIVSLVCAERTTPIRAIAIGTIIAAVAVFETHADRKPVAAMRPITIRRGSVPKMRIVRSAMRRSKCQRWIAAAMRKPPRKRKIVPLA